MANQANLHNAILAASIEKEIWDVAKMEWDLSHIFEEISQCCCGHIINDNCVIVNRHNKNSLIVGNSCINHFEVNYLNVDTNFFVCLKSIRENPKGERANSAVLNKAVQLGIFTVQTRAIYNKLVNGAGSMTSYKLGHRNFDPIKFRKRWNMNRQILAGFNKNRPKCACGRNAEAYLNEKYAFYRCANTERCKFTQKIV